MMTNGPRYVPTCPTCASDMRLEGGIGADRTAFCLRCLTHFAMCSKVVADGRCYKVGAHDGECVSYDGMTAQEINGIREDFATFHTRGSYR